MSTLTRSVLALLFFPFALTAAVVGTNPEPQPLTVARIATLPVSEQPVWRDYLSRSEAALAADRAFYAAELKAAALAKPLRPAKGNAFPQKQPPTWYAGPEARRIADHTLSYQTPAGGWNKNTNFADHARRPGESSGYDNGYVGTIDNGGTVTPLRFLATVIAANRADATTALHRDAFLRGLDYLFTAQLPNGGWPQVYPLEGSYHDAITFNDGAIVNVLTLLRDVAAGTGDFAVVPPATRARATASVARGLDCILKTQIVVADRRTVWGQQHDVLTLAPTSARAYEMPSQAAGESAGIMFFLMGLPDPSPAIVTAVHAAAAWFEKTALKDVVFKPTPDGTGRHLIPTPGATPLWSRYSEIGSDRPIFGDRDRTIHDEIDEISKERRDGYAWFGDSPKRVLAHYAKWAKNR
jgi:PelA/Pel-15E family pectate lyase